MDDNVDVKFLRINTNGFKNAEDDLLASGWKEKRSTRATTKDIQMAYFFYLIKEKAKELQRTLTRDEMAELEAEALELKDTKMYVKPRAVAVATSITKLRKTMRPAAAASMNNSEEYEERPAAAGDERSATAAPKINKIWGQIRSPPPKASFPNASLNLPNNSRDYEGNAIPLNNILRNFNRLNIGNRTTQKRKRGNSINLSNRRKTQKRSKSMNALRAMRRTRFIRRDRRRGSKFSNLPSATRKKYIRRRFSRK